MKEEDLEAIMCIKVKSYMSDEDTDIMWTIYDKHFEPFKGSKTCGECKVEAMKKLINKLT